MAEETWGEYSKLVLKELERLSENSDKMRSEIDDRFAELKKELSNFKSVETKVDNQTKWIEKVSEVWSPTQMKEAKDEIYEQKNRWVAAIAIITFIQVAITIGLSVWSKLK